MHNVTIYADYREEGWESMQVYQRHLVQELRQMGLRVSAFVALPRLSARFPAGGAKLLRYAFRYLINPALAPFRQGDINHILDQANAHLVWVLDPKKTVITVHDLIVPVWMHARYAPVSVRQRAAYAVRFWRIRTLRRAAAIIAVSRATKGELVRHLGIPPERIHVVAEGVAPLFHRIQNRQLLASVAKRYALPRRYLLHVGTTAPYKNIDGVLRVFAALARREPDLVLIKTGSPWTKEQQQRIRTLHLTSRIRHVGFVPRTDLPALYTLAAALIQLSHIEGFGFPVLEAMRCGCPVIASPIAAHKELLGEEGIYIAAPYPSAAIARVHSRLQHSHKHTAAIQKAQRRAARYTWKRAAAQTASVYRTLHASL